MNNLVSIGFSNIVNVDRIIAIVAPDSAPSKRIVRNAKAEGRAIDATHGRRVKAVLVMENNQVVLSALTPDTLLGRLRGNISGETDAE